MTTTEFLFGAGMFGAAMLFLAWLTIDNLKNDY